MAIDDRPTEALQKHLELEEASVSPFTKAVANLMSKLPLPYPFDKAFAAFKEHHSKEGAERTKLMLETVIEEMGKHEEKVNTLASQMDAIRPEILMELLLDGARKAEATRAKERVSRIGTILARAAIEPKLDADEVEEMMRIAMNLSDGDVAVLAEMVRIEGDSVRRDGRIDRYNAHTRWEHGKWGTRVDGNLESICSKLESFGLVSRIAPNNSLNIMADFQNRFALLHKGLRFVTFIAEQR
jgi:hypothetical protein